MKIQEFWQQVYELAKSNEGEVSPFVVSSFLDQAMRQLMILIDPERLHPLGGIFDFQSLQDLAFNVEGFDQTAQQTSLFKIKGKDGMFWPDGIYDDRGIFGWPVDQPVKPELFRIVTLNFAPKYYVAGNAITGGGKLYKAREVTWRKMQAFEDAAVGNPFDSDRFYEQAQLTRDSIQGQYEDEIGGHYNVERTVPMKFAIFGNNLMTHPAVDQDAAILLSVWALFFPERFLYADGLLKQNWVNSTGVCQMPPEFWPAMIEWTASKIRSSAQQERALAMQEVLTNLNLGDAINERRDEARYNKRER